MRFSHLQLSFARGLPVWRVARSSPGRNSSEVLSELSSNVFLHLRKIRSVTFLLCGICLVGQCHRIPPSILGLSRTPVLLFRLFDEATDFLSGFIISHCIEKIKRKFRFLAKLSRRNNFPFLLRGFAPFQVPFYSSFFASFPFIHCKRAPFSLARRPASTSSSNARSTRPSAGPR